MRHRKGLFAIILIAVVGGGVFFLFAHHSPLSKSGKTLFILHTIPEEAHVWIDGKFVGHSPLVVKLPKGQKIKLSLKHEGYYDYDQEIDDSIDHGRIPIRLQKVKP